MLRLASKSWARDPFYFSGCTILLLVCRNFHIFELFEIGFHIVEDRLELADP